MPTAINCELGTKLNLASTVTSVATNFRISILFKHTGAINGEVKFLQNNSDGFLRSVTITPRSDFFGRDTASLRTNGADFSFSSNFGAGNVNTSTILDGEFHQIDLYSDGTTLLCERDGVLIGQPLAFTLPYSNFNNILHVARTAHLAWIKFYESTDTSNLIHHWDAASSNTGNTGAQPILLDIVGGNHATGTGFPTDGTAWVVDAPPAPSIAVSGELRIGQPLTLTYANFTGQPTGPVTISDGTNVVTLTGTTGDFNAGAGTFVTQAFPALPTAGNTVTPYNMLGTVTVTLPDPGA